MATQAGTDNTKRLGQILIDKEFIDRADLEAAVRDQVEELLFSLLSWQTGSFKFYENEFPTKEGITVSLSVENVILEGLRRLDEENMIRETLPDLAQVYRISSSHGGRTRAVTMKASEWNIMALVDGHRSMDTICRISPFKRHETLNRLAQLKLAGLIEASTGKTRPETHDPNLKQMISGLSQLFESYLTEKSTQGATDRSIARQLVGEKSGESY